MARYATPVMIVVVLFAARAWLATAGSTPEGQPALAELHDLQALKSEFNREAGKMRVIISLAPTCPYCLKGATTIERILSTHRDRALVVFNVWQPILPTDWGKPGTRVLGRLSDRRVRQYWDAEHLVARALERSSQGRELQPNCCFERGIWWDFMAVYPPGVQWDDVLPEPMLLDGTVDDAAPAFERFLTATAEGRRPETR
jgi:hypothetical protein